jgi:lysyl-tRNA synthetase class I
MNTLLELESDCSTSDYMFEFYEAAKRAFGDSKGSIRQYFRWLYLVVFGYESGPRWGEFVAVYGREEFVRLVNSRFRSIV